MKDIRHDKDGFLLPKQDKENIEQILQNTETLLKRHNIQARKPQTVNVNVAAPKPKAQNTSNKTEQARSGSLNTSRPTIVQKREQQDRDTLIRQEKVQTEHLEEIAKNSKPKRKNGWLKGLGVAAGVAKGLATMPFRAAKGAFQGGKHALLGVGGRGRGANGQFLPKGVTPKKMGFLGKLGKLGKGVLKGGALGALFGILSGVDIENSDLSRPEKNKAHAKNLAVGAGGVGGAMVGAAIGSVVPVVGTVVGGILGGFGGAALMEHWVDWLDDRIPKNFSNRMFGSWDGFVGTIKDLGRGFIGNSQTHFANFVAQTQAAWQVFAQFATDKWTAFSGSLNSMASAVWETLVPQSFRTYFANLATWGKAAWDNVSSYAASFWESAKNIAQTAFDRVLKPIGDWAGNVYDKGQQLVQQGVDTWNNSSLGQAVNGAVGGAVEKGKEFAGNAVENVKQTGSQLKNGALAFLGYDMTKKYDHLRYGMGRKGLNGGSIDCSGWSFQVSKMEMESLNKMLGFEKYKIKGNQAGSLNLGWHGAAEQIGLVSQQHGVVTDTRTGFDKSKLQAGMMIGQMKKSAKYQGRATNVKGYGKTQYNHIVKVVRGKDGKLYISESQGGSKNGGVTLTEMNKWVDMRKKRGDTLTAVNPFGDDIGLLNGNVGAIAKNEVRKGANWVSGKAVNGVKNTVNAVVPKSKLAHALNFQGGKIHNMSDIETRAFAANVAKTESGFKQDVINKWGYAGLYQFGASALADVGLIDKKKYQQAVKIHGKGLANGSNAAVHKAFLNDANNWTIQGGLQSFLANRAIQDKAFVDLANKNIGYASTAAKNAMSGNAEKTAAYLKMAHLKGAGNASKGLTVVGFDRKDGNGTSMKAYGQGAANDLRSFSQQVAQSQSVVTPTAPQAVKMPTVPAPAKPIAPPAVVTHPAPAPKNVPKSEFSGASVFDGSIAHKPVSRTLGNSQLAHMASGGIMDNQS